MGIQSIPVGKQSSFCAAYGQPQEWRFCGYPHEAAAHCVPCDGGPLEEKANADHPLKLALSRVRLAARYDTMGDLLHRSVTKADLLIADSLLIAPLSREDSNRF